MREISVPFHVCAAAVTAEAREAVDRSNVFGVPIGVLVSWTHFVVRLSAGCRRHISRLLITVTSSKESEQCREITANLHAFQYP